MSIFTIPVTVMAFLANATAIGRLRDARRALEARAADTAGGSSSAAGSSSVANGNGSGNGSAPAATPRKSSLPGALLLLFGIQSVFAGFTSRAQDALAGTGHLATAIKDAVDTFTIQPRNARSLFYLQRTSNINTIICELNEKNGVVDKDEPVHVLWIRYTDRRQREELSFIQRHFAYGLKEKALGNDTYELRFVSYKQIPFYLMKSPLDNQHHVYASITGRQAILNRIYIKINPGGTFWSPNVEYLELKGVDPRNGKELIQRIKV